MDTKTRNPELLVKCAEEWNVKQFQLAVCPKTTVWSQMRRNRECFFGPNLTKNGFLGRNFENLCPFLESAPPKYHACQFIGKTNSFDFFGSNLLRNGF